jgi:hypothetical protein
MVNKITNDEREDEMDSNLQQVIFDIYSELLLKRRVLLPREFQVVLKPKVER